MAKIAFRTDNPEEMFSIFDTLIKQQVPELEKMLLQMINIWKKQTPKIVLSKFEIYDKTTEQSLEIIIRKEMLFDFIKQTLLQLHAKV
jgi:hypothetical protein